MRQKPAASIGIILLVCTVYACSVARSKRPFSLITLEIDAAASDREAAVKQTVAIIESRLDAVGVSNFDVQPEGNHANGRILVSFSAVSDPERIKRIVTAGGAFEITHIISPPFPAPVQTYNTKEEALASLSATLPPNRRVLPYYERNETTAAEQTDVDAEEQRKWVVLESPAIVVGSELRYAAPIKSRPGEDYEIVFILKPTGAGKLEVWTGSHIDEYIGVVCNEEVKSIVYIKAQISSDRGEISGTFTKQSAEDLVHVLNSGALPAPVKIVSEAVNK